MYVPIIRLRKKDNFNKVDVFCFLKSKHQGRNACAENMKSYRSILSVIN